MYVVFFALFFELPLQQQRQEPRGFSAQEAFFDLLMETSSFFDLPLMF
jgi:hypothetical protein